MTTSLSADPLFTVRRTTSLTAADIAAVAAGRIAALRIPSMLAPQDCAAVLASLESAGFDTYDPVRVFPRVAKFGPAVNDHREARMLRPAYWSAAERAWAVWRSLPLPLDPIEHCVKRLRDAWPGPVSIGATADRRMFAGVIREINLGLQVHFDDLHREYDDPPFGGDVVAQLAFNLYLCVPDAGGETVIWRKRWGPTDEKSRIPHGYGYDQTVVDDVPFLSIKPHAGEAFVFDPRNYHTVAPVADSRRVSLGFFMALTADGGLVLWS